MVASWQQAFLVIHDASAMFLQVTPSVLWSFNADLTKTQLVKQATTLKAALDLVKPTGALPDSLKLAFTNFQQVYNKK